MTFEFFHVDEDNWMAIYGSLCFQFVEEAGLS